MMDFMNEALLKEVEERFVLTSTTFGSTNETRNHQRLTFGTGQMLVWSRAGVICDVMVSREREGVYVEINETSEFKDELGTPPPPKLTRWQKAKALWKEHGLVFVMGHGTLWIVPFVPMFGMLQSCGQIDCARTLETFSADRISLSGSNPTAINIIVATECNEVLDFVRLPFVVANNSVRIAMVASRKECLPFKEQFFKQYLFFMPPNYFSHALANRARTIKHVIKLNPPQMLDSIPKDPNRHCSGQ